MNRFGWIFLAALAVLLAGFILLIRPGGPVRPPPARTPSPPFADITPSGLAIPVANVAVAALHDTFGEDRGGGARRHNALDIAAARGTPVLAAAAGRVEKLFLSDAGGNTVYVRSPSGRFVYYYAHLDRYADGLREGLAVNRGQQIGTVGFSGNADPAGPHLHFEIKRMAPGETWYQGMPINPYPVLAGK